MTTEDIPADNTAVPFVKVTRTFSANRERVFQAWTDPGLIPKWWLADGHADPWAEVDLRLGGEYRLGMRNTEGKSVVAFGSFTEVQPPERLVYTWRWEGSPMGETMVTVEFSEVEDGTALTLTHTGFPVQEAADQHGHGWEACLMRMEDIV